MGTHCGSSALSSCICTSHSELRRFPCTRAAPPLTPKAGCCFHFPTASPVVLVCLVAWPCHLTGLMNDAAKNSLSSTLFFFFVVNDISSLSLTAEKTKAGKGRSLLALQSSKCDTEQLLCSGKPLKRHLRDRSHPPAGSYFKYGSFRGQQKIPG